jgi:hypothetical protein
MQRYLATLTIVLLVGIGVHLVGRRPRAHGRSTSAMGGENLKQDDLGAERSGTATASAGATSATADPSRNGSMTTQPLLPDRLT